MNTQSTLADSYPPDNEPESDALEGPCFGGTDWCDGPRRHDGLPCYACFTVRRAAARGSLELERFEL